MSEKNNLVPHIHGLQEYLSLQSTWLWGRRLLFQQHIKSILFVCSDVRRVVFYTVMLADKPDVYPWIVHNVTRPETVLNKASTEAHCYIHWVPDKQSVKSQSLLYKSDVSLSGGEADGFTNVVNSAHI